MDYMPELGDLTWALGSNIYGQTTFMTIWNSDFSDTSNSFDDVTQTPRSHFDGTLWIIERYAKDLFGIRDEVHHHDGNGDLLGDADAAGRPCRLCRNFLGHL